jgi:hypothetical protein
MNTRGDGWHVGIGRGENNLPSSRSRNLGRF